MSKNRFINFRSQILNRNRPEGLIPIFLLYSSFATNELLEYFPEACSLRGRTFCMFVRHIMVPLYAFLYGAYLTTINVSSSSERKKAVKYLSMIKCQQYKR